MLAARNKRFRIAAALGALAYLMLAVRSLIAADHILRQTLAGGYIVAAILFVAVHGVGAGGWVVIAAGFGRETDWRRLRFGGAILASALAVEYVAWVFYVVPTLARVHIDDYRHTYIWAAFGALLVAVGACIVVTGFAKSRRGSSRAHRLWLGAIVGTAGYGAATVAQLYLQSFYSNEHAVHEATIGTLVQAVGTFGLTLAGVVFVRAARRPFARREASLVGAAAGGAVASLCLAGGATLVAIAYGSYGSVVWQTVVAWLDAGSTFVVAAAFLALALGARQAATSR